MLVLHVNQMLGLRGIDSNDWRETIPIHVLEGGQLFDPNELSLDEFINPSCCSANDIRELFLPGGILKKIYPEQRRRSFSSSLLYDTRGLELFEELTKLEDEYYLTACEKSLLKCRLREIAVHIPDGAAIVELGCGSMTKTAIILDYLRNVAKKKNLRFYGLDIDDTYLRQSLENLRSVVEKEDRDAEYTISYAGIHGTFEQLVSFLPNIPGPRYFLWLGSTIGNMTRQEAADLLRFYRETMEPEDGFFLAADKRNDPRTIVRAYNDSKGIIAALGMNTLVCLNRLLGQNVFDVTKFERWSGYNIADGQNEAYIKSLTDQKIVIPAPFSGDKEKSAEVHLKKDELIHYLYSVKYSSEDLKTLAVAAGLTVEQIWTDPKEMFYFTLLKKSSSTEE